MKYQHFSLGPLLPLWTHCTKRFVCAVKSFLSFYPSLSCKVPNRQTLRVCIQIASFVATAVLLYVRTIRGEHCLIAKSVVCAAKSLRGFLGGHWSAKCPLTKRYVCVLKSLRAVNSNDDSHIRTFQLPPDVTKRNENQWNINSFVVCCVSDGSARNALKTKELSTISSQRTLV